MPSSCSAPSVSDRPWWMSTSPVATRVKPSGSGGVVVVEEAGGCDVPGRRSTVPSAGAVQAASSNNGTSAARGVRTGAR